MTYAWKQHDVALHKGVLLNKAVANIVVRLRGLARATSVRKNVMLIPPSITLPFRAALSALGKRQVNTEHGAANSAPPT
ncbi:MAG TPA: hypothetical protein VEZ48_06465 [Sphingomonadaceae bacterium]|nr:hypothetical protein [Sphingomonadaceae bacterium]